MNKPVIICIDDELTILDSLEIQLRKAFNNEYLIETAADGQEALELVKELLAEQYEVALVIADCLMPNMQGDELLRHIHAISPKTIKIMLTGQADLEAVGNAINYANLYRYITKPWQDEDLKLTVQEAIRSYFQEKKLAQQNAKLMEYNQNLEQLVNSRTQELEEKNRQLQQEIRTKEEAARDRDWAESLLAGQNQILEMIAKGVPISEVLQALAQVIEAHSQQTSCAFQLLDEKGVALSHIAAPSLPESYIKAIDRIEIGPEVGSCGRAAYWRKPVIVEDIANDPLWTGGREIALSYGLRACWSAPILSWTGKVLGTFAIYCRQKRSPTSQEQQLITRATNLARIAIKRQQSEEALLASEKKYRALVEASQDMIWSVDAQGRYTFVNQAVKQIYGYEPEEMLGRPFADFEPPEQLARDLDLFGRLLNGESVFQYESTQVAKDGRPLYLLSNAIALRDEQGNVIGATGTASDITKRKQTEEALRQSELMLRQITNTMPGVVYQFMLTRQGEKKYRFISQGAYQLLGYTAQQLVEDYALQWNQILPDDRDRINKSVNASAEQCQPWFEEFRINHTNGQVRWIQGHSLPGESLPDGSLTWTGTLIDITDRKQREEALRLIVEGTASKTGNEFFRSCVRYLAQLLHVRYALVTEWGDQSKTRLRTLAFWTGDDFGENFEYNIANNPCHQVMEGLTCYYPENVQTLFPNNPDLVALGAQSYLGIPLTNASGNVLGHLAVMDTKPMSIAPDSSDVPAERLHILQIFAARAIGELERKLAEDALKQSAYAADAANRAKSGFLSRMSHELRTPLNAILGFTQVMNRSPSLSPEAQEHLGIISRSGEHLLELINDILEMSKIESGRITLNETSFDLYALLDTLKEMFQLKAKFKSTELIFYRALDVPQYVKTDESKLRQVLINLLSNAIKFTESGRVTLRVIRKLQVERLNVEGLDPLQVERLNVEGSNRSSNFQPTHLQPETLIQPTILQFAVEDTGPGIAPEEMHLLFVPFEQTESGRKSQQGTGLGLPLTRQFVQLMGGDITVSSTVGKGTLFKFDVPLCMVQSQDVEAPQKSRRVIGLAPDQPSYRILVVDDVRLSRLLLVKLLTLTGFEVREATNGLEAITMWENWQPHLIFMDMQMPVMDGYEATRQIKAREQGSNGAGEQGSRAMKPSPHPQGDEVSGVHSSWFMVHSNELSTMNHEQGGFHPHPRGDEALSPSLVEKSLLIQNSQSTIRNRKTAIIALTANAFEEDRTVILATGCDDFVTKPFQEETIFEKIAQYLGVCYVYEKPVSISSEVRPQDEETPSNHCLEVSLSQMPAEWITQVYQAAATGSDSELFGLIEQIPPTYARLHNALTDWINDFRFDQIINLIQQVKS